MIEKLDVTRDFDRVEDISRYLTGWMRHPAAPYATTCDFHVNPRTGQLETLYVGTQTSGRVVFYDKSAQSPGKARPGTGRFEVQAKPPWLSRYGGIESVSDLSTDTVRALLQDRWEWSGFSAPISGRSTFLQRVEALTDEHGKPWRRTKKAGYIAHHLWAATGGPVDQPSKSLKAEYNRALLKTGMLVFDRDSGAPVPGPTSRLDFQTGREVVDAAA